MENLMSAVVPIVAAANWILVVAEDGLLFNIQSFILPFLASIE
jgi:hypothetical protein